ALTALLDSPSPHNRRAAAEALGRIGAVKAVPALLAATARTSDRVLEHSLTYALIEIGAAEPTAAGLKSNDVNTRRGALTALDQMEKGGLDSAQILPALDAADLNLRETAWWIAGRHPEWGTALSAYLKQRLAADVADPKQGTALASLLGRLARTPAIQQLL